MIRAAIVLALACALSACAPASRSEPPRASTAPALLFPAPDRPVATIVTNHSGPEAERDAEGEAETVMTLLGVAPGMTIADVGAGEGYFTTRLSRRLGPEGRVIASDVMANYLAALKARVAREGLANVSFVLGAGDDPRLPPGAVDIVLMVRMYHEIEQPYALMWRLHEALKPGGRIAISERDRPTQFHGTPPALLKCELEAVGYRQVAFHPLSRTMGYLAVFEPAGPRPEPSAIRACRARG